MKTLERAIPQSLSIAICIVLWAPLSLAVAQEGSGVSPGQPWTDAPPCERVQRERTQLITEAWARFENTHPAWDGPGPPDLPTWLGRCFSAETGAWALRLMEVDFDIDRDAEWEIVVDAVWTVAFLGADRMEAGLAPELDTGLGSGNYYRDTRGDVQLTDAGLFDWDGDGLSELWVLAEYLEVEDAGHRIGGVYTLDDTRVTRYAPAEEFATPEVRDVDRDGRPDLITYGPFEAVLSDPCRGMADTHRGPELLAHALPDGTFSPSDGQASAYGLRDCPDVPIRLDEMRDVACARLWGLESEAILEMVMLTCPAWTRSTDRGAIRAACETEEPVPDLCFNLDDVTAWAGASWPLTLSSSPGE